MTATWSSSSRTTGRDHFDRFQPRYPAGPSGSSVSAPQSSGCSASSGLNEPWLLEPDRIPPLTAYRRDVVLVLGTPSESSVLTLLTSPALVYSLVIFASHRPPTLPPSPVSSVRILHLASPLAVEDAGAARLVSTLEWAERVARTWRASGPDGAGVICYEEAAKGIPIPAYGLFSHIFVDMSPGSTESFGKKSSMSRRVLPITGQRRRSHDLSGHLSTGPLPPVDPSQRPFDAIINYIPRDLTEKCVLKQAILVTSITRPFLVPSLSPYHKLSGAKRNLRRSLSGRSPSLPPTPPYQSRDISTFAASSVVATPDLSTPCLPPPYSRVVHVIPPTAHINLAQNLDRFLSSFSLQTIGQEVDHAKQYVLSSSTMREPVIYPRFNQGKCTVLDVVLIGGLDSISGKSWIGSGHDILFIATSSPPSVSPSSPVPPKLVRPPPSTTLNSRRSVNRVSHTRARAKTTSQSPPPYDGPPTGSRRSGEHPQPAPERVSCAFPDLSHHSDPIHRPYAQGPYHPRSLNPSPGRATRRPRPVMITKPDGPIDTTSGLPTPPDSDEDERHPSPPRSIVSRVSMLQNKRSNWKFWKQ